MPDGRWLPSLALSALLIFNACGRSRALAEEGLKSSAEGKQISALEFFDRALKSNAKEPLALYGKGMLLTEEKITEDIAISMLSQAIGEPGLKEKFSALARLKLAEIYAGRGDKDEALAQLDKLSGNSKLVGGAGVQRIAATYLKLKDTKHAQESLTAHLEAEPGDEATQLYLVKLYLFVRKDNSAATNECRRYGLKKETTVKPVLICAKILINSGDFAAAANLLDAHAQKPGLPAEALHDLRESISRKRGKFPIVEQDF